MPNRIEAAKRKLSHKPPGDYCHCASSRLHKHLPHIPVLVFEQRSRIREVALAVSRNPECEDAGRSTTRSGRGWHRCWSRNGGPMAAGGPGETRGRC
jgi:hypothetical protein